MSQSSTDSYTSVLTDARSKVQAGLDLSDEIIANIAVSAPGELRARMEKIIARKGKRVRSTLLFLIGATGTKPASLERRAKAASSIELLHLASLLHDDIIDETDMRRGEPTAHTLWGNRMAVLVGDYALSKALELVVVDEDQRVAKVVSEASSKLVAGEVLELDLAGKDLTIEQYYQVIDGKTAALIEACAACGSILAGHSDELVKACGEMGRDFGIAFQIIDDLLDYGFGASDLGKAKYSDLQNGLSTLPMILYYQNLTETEIDHITELRSKGERKDIQKEIISLLTAKNCFLGTQEIAMKHIKQALSTLNSLPDSLAKEQLLSMCGSMATRSN
jgi:octaprenyl-diphosphate synthase